MLETVQLNFKIKSNIVCSILLKVAMRVISWWDTPIEHNNYEDKTFKLIKHSNLENAQIEKTPKSSKR